MARESFANKTTAILAMAGSAIGLGNIWRFPYMVGQNGGAAFILVYLLSAIFICVPIFISEAYIGKRTQLSTFGAFEKLAPGTGWKWVGLLSVVTPVIILSFYSVVGGWSLSYLFKSLSLSFIDAGATRETHGAVFEALFAKAVPNYDAERFYVSHMKKVCDWYNDLAANASLDFEEEEEK